MAGDLSHSVQPNVSLQALEQIRAGLEGVSEPIGTEACRSAKNPVADVGTDVD